VRVLTTTAEESDAVTSSRGPGQGRPAATPTTRTRPPRQSSREPQALRAGSRRARALLLVRGRAPAELLRRPRRAPGDPVPVALEPARVRRRINQPRTAPDPHTQGRALPGARPPSRGVGARRIRGSHASARAGAGTQSDPKPSHLTRSTTRTSSGTGGAGSPTAPRPHPDQKPANTNRIPTTKEKHQCLAQLHQRHPRPRKPNRQTHQRLM
jgi:hypothetical protein